ncbi:MAG: Uma2 family endonuclease [Candidatus Viridilinea halotolerans]|uniref:Uma2 family endonuclease n=1 Tax=Candidatus Viridilinea halotolerans TaxID=2491704 RepID=A0A426UB97_9CHLR|nr:MAG: Uma2 family endonuclease [Candidatus Viridilinea halotolerans]
MTLQDRTKLQALQLIAIPNDPIWRLQVDQYHAMIRAGILTEDDPIELLEGWLVTKMPKNPRHRVCTQTTRELLAQMVPPGWYVDDQEPITTEDSEPEPDIVVVRGQRRDYLARHPMAQEIALVVEVADATLQRDRTSKKRLYARAGIQVYWIMNLVDRQVEVYTKPVTHLGIADYAEQRIFLLQDQLEVVLHERVLGVLPVAELLF